MLDNTEISKIEEYLSEKTYLDQTPLEINFEGKDKLSRIQFHDFVRKNIKPLQSQTQGDVIKLLYSVKRQKVNHKTSTTLPNYVNVALKLKNSSSTESISYLATTF